MLKSLLISTLVLISISSIAQSIDISGTWSGNSYFGTTQITTRYEIEQNGNEISGFVYTKSKKDSAKMVLKGSLNGKWLRVKTTKYVYKKGSACLSNITLKYSVSDNFQSLSGKWKCVVSGRIELFKQVASPAPQIFAKAEPSKETRSIHKDDFEGNELVKGLADRKYYALIIANEDYKDGDIQDLDNPVKDAIGLSGILNEHYTFEKENIKFLKNASRTQIIEAFDHLASKIEAVDNLLIFYAGHGIWDKRLNQGFWLPSDASMNSKAQWLSNSTIRDYISGIRSKHTLLITDACFSGSIFKERGVFNNSKAILEMYRLPSRKAMTSGTLKTVPDKSVFIQYLSKNLINNTHPLLSAGQLFNDFKVAVINNSPNGQVPQYGPIGQAGDEGGDFIFLKRSSGSSK